MLLGKDKQTRKHDGKAMAVGSPAVSVSIAIAVVARLARRVVFARGFAGCR